MESFCCNEGTEIWHLLPLFSSRWLSQRSSLLPLQTVWVMLPGGGLWVLLHTHRPLLPQQETESWHPQVRLCCLMALMTVRIPTVNTFVFQNQCWGKTAHQSLKRDHLLSVGLCLQLYVYQIRYWIILCNDFSSQLHVMDETHVINQVKEDVCYVSQQFYKDMEIAQ